MSNLFYCVRRAAVKALGGVMREEMYPAVPPKFRIEHVGYARLEAKCMFYHRNNMNFDDRGYAKDKCLGLLAEQMKQYVKFRMVPGITNDEFVCIATIKVAPDDMEALYEYEH